MADIREIRFDSWREFTRDLIPDLVSAGPYQATHLFRGMGSARWRLESAFDRVFVHVPPDEREAHFAGLLDLFRDACREHGVADEVCRDDQRLIALGQHYGLPTRLLDWTTSPYVAAYFAYRNVLRCPDPADSHVVLWMLHRASGVWSGHDVDVIRVPTFRNDRARSQAGLFTRSRSPFGSLEEVVSRCVEVDGVALTRMLLPVGDVRAVLADLDLMGISESTLFPDLTGAATACLVRLLLARA
jgi:hypothetical protein